MNIHQMHDTFRTIGQQMGLQLFRAILPESIDVFINNAIVELTQIELLGGVRTALQDSVNTQASTISPVNTFRNLYRTMRYTLEYDERDLSDIDDNKVPRADSLVRPDTPIAFANKVSYWNKANGYHVINLPTIGSKVRLNADEYKINPMHYLGFSVEFDETLRGNPVSCRMIGADVLETTLRDYGNGAGKDSPIVVLSSIPIVNEDGTESLDGISNEQLEIYTNCKGCKIKVVNIKYVKVPNVVRWDIDPDKCINCDLPAYTHFGIVEQAVRKFYAAVGATGGQQQPQQQVAQQVQ